MITCNMRIAGVQYASCFFATRILFFRLFHIQIDVYDFYINSRFTTKISSSFCHFNKKSATSQLIIYYQ